MDIKDFLNSKRVAVVGSFANVDKVAYRVVKMLKDRGYEVFPVNPNIKSVMDLLVYKSIICLPEGIDFVNFITPPQITKKLLDECKQKKINKVWFQPGASNEEVLEYAKLLNFQYVSDTCLMMNL